MSAVDKLDPHQGGLGAEEIGIDLVQLVPAQVVVAVSGRPGKIVLRHAVFLERAQHPLGVLCRNGVNMSKPLGKLRHGLVAQGLDALIYL